MMKKYWLLLDAYVFIWANEKTVLIYNSLSGKHASIPLMGLLRVVIKQLLDETNLYCIEVTEEELNHREVKNFVDTIRLLFMGDLYPQSLFPQKPLVVVPSDSVNEDLENTVDNSNNLELFGQKITKNLHTVSIRLTGKCAYNCHDCNKFNKQFTWCKKSNNILEYKLVIDVLKQMEHAHIPFVQFLGGNLLCYPYLEELVSSLTVYSFNKYFYIHSQQFINNLSFAKAFINDKSLHIRFLVDSSTKKDDINNCLALGTERVEYIFAVTSVSDFEGANSLIDEFQLKASIYPFYNHKNLPFFEEFVFQNIEDISDLHRNKKDIFANRRINFHFFGKLLIDCDGKVYSNVNMTPIGQIGEKISEWVFKEMKDGQAWNLIRDKLVPCKDCLYRYLCPAPSNYELVIGKPNLCHIKS